MTESAPKDLSELAVPEPAVFIDAVDAGKRADEFFGDVIDFLGYSERAAKTFVDVNYYELARKDGEPLNDAVHVMRVGDRVVATVFEVRTEHNNTQFLPSCHLTPELVESLRENPDLLRD